MKSTKIHWLFALVLSSFLLSACQQQMTKKVVAVTDPAITAINNVAINKSPNDNRSYAAILLPNHLQVVLVSDPELENSAASLAVGVGTAQDPEDQQGLAHYLEHMLFLGTSKFPEPDGFMKFTQTGGGMTNAVTSYDKTNYLFQINATKFDDALNRFSDYFKSPTFDATYSDKERHAVDNEWSLQKQQDSRILNRIDALTGNPNSPHAKFSTGNLQTLVDRPDKTLNDNMKEFFKRYYSSNNMRLTLVGKQSIPELKALAQKYFSDIPNKNIAPPDITASGLTDAETFKHIYYKPNKDIKALFVDFPMKSNKHQWRLKPNEYVLNLLTTEEPGTFCEQLRKKGLASSVTAYSNTDLYGPDGYLRVQVELTDVGLTKQDEVVAAIIAYTELIKRTGLNEKYYQELRAIRAKDFLNALKPTPLQQAIHLSDMQFELPVENLLDASSIFERFDENAIQDVLNQLDAHKMRIWHISKRERVNTPVSFFDGQYAIEPVKDAEYEHINSLAKKLTFNLPPLNNLFTDHSAPIVENKYLKPHEVVSEAGIEAFLQHPEFYREDKGQLSLEINTRQGQPGIKNVVLAYLLNEFFEKQNMTLSDRAANASLKLSVSVNGPNSQTIAIAGYTSKHSVLLDEVLKNFVRLEFSQNVFSEALSNYKDSLANNSKNSVYLQLYNRLDRMSRADSWSDEELLVAANKIKLADVINYYKAVKRDPLLRIFAVGNYSEADVQQMAKAAVKVLPGKRMPNTRVITQYRAPASGEMHVSNKSSPLADSALMQVWLRDKKSDDEQAQLGILDAFLDKSLFAQLRTNEQLGYVVQASPYVVDDIPGYMMLVQSSNSDLVKIKASMDNFRRNYFEVLKAIPSTYIEATKQSMIENIMQKPTNFYQEASQYTREFWHAKYDFDARDRYLIALKMVSKDDLTKLYEDLFLNEKSSGVLLQLRGTNAKDAPFASVKSK